MAIQQRKTPAHPVGRPTEAEIARRMQHVVRVATRLFLRDGYAATSLKQIATEAGVATKTLYFHIGDKSDLFRSIVVSRETEAASGPPELDISGTLVDVLSRVGRYARETALNDAAIEVMRLVVSERNRFPELAAKACRTSSLRIRDDVAQVFRGLSDLLPISEEDIGPASEMFVDLVLGDAVLCAVFGFASPSIDEPTMTKKINMFIRSQLGPDRLAEARPNVRTDACGAPMKLRKLQ